VADYFKINQKNLKSSSKEGSVTKSRRVFCYLAVRKLGYQCSDVSKILGVSAVTVSKSVAMGSRLSEIGEIEKQTPARNRSLLKQV